jgi:hypothetical protein
MENHTLDTHGILTTRLFFAIQSTVGSSNSRYGPGEKKGHNSTNKCTKSKCINQSRQKTRTFFEHHGLLSQVLSALAVCQRFYKIKTKNKKQIKQSEPYAQPDKCAENTP